MEIVLTVFIVGFLICFLIEKYSDNFEAKENERLSKEGEEIVSCPGCRQRMKRRQLLSPSGWPDSLVACESCIAKHYVCAHCKKLIPKQSAILPFWSQYTVRHSSASASVPDYYCKTCYPIVSADEQGIIAAFAVSPTDPAYYKTFHWLSFRDKVLKAKGRKCSMCGATRRIMNVHHLHYKTVGNESMDDVRVLCEQCHAKVHGRSHY